MLALQQPCLEHLHGQLPVLVLGALVLALDHDARRQVGEADGRVGLVDVLAAGALRAVGVDAQVVVGDLTDLDVVLDLRQHLHQREGGVAPLLGVEGADAHQPVDAALGAQVAVGAPRPSTLMVALLMPASSPSSWSMISVAEAMPLGPAEVHPEQHLGPVGGLGAAGARR